MKKGCIKIIRIFKKALIHFRTSVKIISVLFLASLTTIGIVSFIYHPIYAVYFNDELIGYSSNKTKIQKKINDYMDNGDSENVAFVDIENLPQYKLCLLKKNIKANDEEILTKVKASGINYYTYYAIVENGVEKCNISKLEDAQNVLNQLQEKNSDNKDNLSIEQKYEKDLGEFVTSEQAVAQLYKEVTSSKRVASSVTSRSKDSTSSEKISTSMTISNSKPNLGINLIEPVSGKITSRYGEKSGIRSGAHTGLDIANSYGTPIKACASGTVVFAGTKGSYGRMVIISHGNGVQTYYGHNSSLKVSVGQTVSQGQTIALMGSTGNSTGNHCHLEIRLNGTSLNPSYYLY